MILNYSSMILIKAKVNEGLDNLYALYLTNRRRQNLELLLTIYWTVYFHLQNLFSYLWLATLETDRRSFYLKYNGMKTLAKWCPPYWIRHLRFDKFDFRFVVSGPKNPWIPNLVWIGQNLQILYAILDPPSWIQQIGLRIRNQRTRKPPSTKFCVNWSEYANCIRHIGCAIFNLSNLTTASWSAHPKTPVYRVWCKLNNFVEIVFFYRLVGAILESSCRICFHQPSYLLDKPIMPPDPGYELPTWVASSSK